MRVRVSPTPSNTPSNTPTITPSVSSCPLEQFAAAQIEDCDGASLSGISVNLITNRGTYVISGTTGNPFIIGNCFPSFYPYIGAVYSTQIEVPNGYELCETELFGYFDRLDFIVESYLGNPFGVGETWSGNTYHYLNNELVSIDGDTLCVSNIGAEYECQTMLLPQGDGTVFNFAIKKIPATPTPTVTQTNTPSPTSCYQPKSYILFDSQTGATALNSWMGSQGSSFRGMFINGPSLVPATFERQMNSYINYSGFSPSQYYALLPQSITPNQNPIIWNEEDYPSWSDTFVWVNMIVPTCPICEGGEYGLVGASGSAIHTTNDVYRSMPFYYSGTAIPTGYYRLYTTYSNTDMRLSENGSQYILGDLVCPATPTPSPTTTQTRTPTVTPTNTSTPTVTPTCNPLFNSVAYGTTAPNACYNPTGYLNISGDSCNFCFATKYYSTGFATFANGNYYLQYNGSTVNINISGAPTTIATMYGAGCEICPTATPTQTPEPTTTTTQTPSPSAPIQLCIDITTNNSLDISITQVIVNGLIASVTGGVLPNTPGNGTNLEVALAAGTYDVQIAYTCSVAGQRIDIVSPITGYACQNTSTGSSSLTFTNVGFSSLPNCLQITAQDGTC